MATLHPFWSAPWEKRSCSMTLVVSRSSTDTQGWGEWVELGGTDEQKPAKEGTVEAWGRASSNPVGGWYGLKKDLLGRFGVLCAAAHGGAQLV
jgi:hypothetical protein